MIEEIEDNYDDWINMPKVRKALDGFEKKKSPGTDGIKPVLFEHLDVDTVMYLIKIFKSSIFLAYTPRKWRETKVIFIPKPGKTDYRVAKAYRPISLSNYFLKTLERLVGWKMDEALLEYPIHHKQHGFLKEKSTESALSNTVNYIEKFMFKQQYALGVFLDISAAFDSICPEHVKRCLEDHGGDPDLIKWYYGYLKQRSDL